MFVARVLSIQKTFDVTHKQVNLDPISSRGVAQLGSIYVVTEPVVKIF